LEVAHYGDRDLPAGPVQWTLKSSDGEFVAHGEQPAKAINARGVFELGAIKFPLARVREPSALTLSVRFAGAQNHWKLWVYPTAPDEPEPARVLMTRALDDAALKTLKTGGKVLLLAHGVKNAHTAKTGFESVYWSAGWWGNRFSSLGLLCDPKHPALATFPNDGVSDWQWRELCAGATTFDLTGAPAGFLPIVQPVPDFHYNALLGRVFEAKVGSGSLLVCGYDLTTNLDARPAARQFRRSLLRYVGSSAFRPTMELPWSWIESRCQGAGLNRRGARVIQMSSEDRANGHVAANVLDGDPTTYWHTRWEPQSDPMPHELVIDLGRELTLRGITCLPRQDQSNGRIAQVEAFCSNSVESWGSAVAIALWSDSEKLQTIEFRQTTTARYLKLAIKSEVNGNPFAALAELEVITKEAN
jgi:hypothetical protein